LTLSNIPSSEEKENTLINKVYINLYIEKNSMKKYSRGCDQARQRMYRDSFARGKTISVDERIS
jgi:hypothetical protein